MFHISLKSVIITFMYARKMNIILTMKAFNIITGMSCPINITHTLFGILKYVYISVL